MDDRNLVAVAEQAAATSRVLRSKIAGCTVLADDGRHFRGCRLEFEDASADLCPVACAVAAARVDGAQIITRAGFYTPTGGELPPLPASTIQLLREVTAPGFVMIVSAGSGEYVEKTLEQLGHDAGLVSG